MAEIKEWLSRVITENHVFIDVGAHIGCVFVKTVEKAKPFKAIAFEPTSESFDFLKKNCEAFLDPGTYELHNAAVTDQTGETFMYDCSWGSPSNTLKDRFEGKHKPTIPVKTIRLDDLEIPKDRRIILKVDAELSEPEVWRGMQKLLPQVDAMVMEIFAHGYPGADIHLLDMIKEIREAGFNIYNINTGSYKERISDEQIIRSGKTDIIIQR